MWRPLSPSYPGSPRRRTRLPNGRGVSDQNSGPGCASNLRQFGGHRKSDRSLATNTSSVVKTTSRASFSCPSHLQVSRRLTLLPTISGPFLGPHSYVTCQHSYLGSLTCSRLNKAGSTGQGGVRKSPGCHREARRRRGLSGVARLNIYGPWPWPHSSNPPARSRATLQMWQQCQVSMVQFVRTHNIGRRGRSDIDICRKIFQQ